MEWKPLKTTMLEQIWKRPFFLNRFFKNVDFIGYREDGFYTLGWRNFRSFSKM